jgi:hypothetical protein
MPIYATCTITMHGNQHFILRYLLNHIRPNLCIAPGVTHYLNGTYFKGLSINTDVDFTPLPTIFHAMFFSFPLAFAPHLDTHAFCAEMTALRRFVIGRACWSRVLSNQNWRVEARFLQSLFLA